MPTNNAVETFRKCSPGQPVVQGPSIGQIVGELLDRERGRKFKTISIEDDAAFRNAVAHVLKPKQLLADFIASSGLGPAQAASMTPEEISVFVQQAERNAAEDLNAPSEKWEPIRFRGVPAKYSE
jgi:hypothetical protein